MTKYRTVFCRSCWQGRKEGQLPPRLTFALAALIAFYRGEREGEAIRYRMTPNG
jgi:tagaturonate reductase